MNADLAFQHAANSAAVYAATTPAYVRYISRTHIAIPSMRRERDVNCREVTRVKDGATYIADLPRGSKRVESSAFPMPPTFNAVSAFDLRYGMSFRGVATFRLSNVQPMTYRAVRPTDADVVVVSTRGYHVKYAPDSSEDVHGETHLLLSPSALAIKDAPQNAYFFSEMLIDNSSGLPLRVAYVGANDFHMNFQYGFTSGRWAIETAHLESTLHAPLNLGRVHFVADTTFSEMQFSPISPVPEI